LKIAKAAHHRHRHSAGQLSDDRVIRRRTRAHIDAAGRESLRLRAGGERQRQQAGCDAQTSNEVLFHSFFRFKSRFRVGGLWV
jgi:hypothetical protein